ncbi:sensor histidine kinase [Agrobacterium pusense]|uniref:sensor histidine kinase n=1 Tax=Agrobacterium pusense TaxID=648995 RepID=UPI000888E534|nr:sensor histidine kinase [Agrobacterium pusense]OOO24351.1 histidine kinase [Agrobacterium pusense]WKD43380.1 sensor histidine kinase [Agrobacterium pusense]SDE73529.1 Signal transduction histidine kinase [Agrobacterium pusense]
MSGRTITRLSSKTLGSLSLAQQFFLAGGLVTLGATVLIGLLVTDQIVETATRNAGSTTALYVDSIIAPILPDLTRATKLDDSIERTLDETLGQGALGRRLVSFRLWTKDGTIIYSNDKRLMNMVVPPGENRTKAFAGELVANFEEAGDPESDAERALGEPLLEIYNPVLQPWSGEVVAVAEFYERATDLEKSLARARWKSWIVVIAVASAFFAVLSTIVLKGSRMIRHQLREIEDLARRVQKGSQRTVALNERLLRKIGADLHDGPAQLIAYAALRVDSEKLVSDQTSRNERESETTSIKASLDEAIRDIRNICRGLVLPDIENLPIEDVVGRAVEHHQSRAGTRITTSIENVNAQVGVPVKICAYRFVQEGLNNGWRHAASTNQCVSLRQEGTEIVATVSDGGSGFSFDEIGPDCIGLSGLKERIESLGGRFEVQTSARGTHLTMRLNTVDVSDP